MRATFRRGCAVAICGALLLAGCGDDDDDAGDTTGTTVADDETTTTAGDEPAGDTVTVQAKDYEFVDLPSSVDAGTKLSLTNASESELHEFVAIRLNDDETRSVDELIALPEEEQAAISSSEPGTVILALPGQTDVPGPVVGDGTLTEPGRYIVVCAIPTGVNPEAYMAAAQEATDGPPQVEGGDGPPHFTQGMFAELTVK